MDAPTITEAFVKQPLKHTDKSFQAAFDCHFVFPNARNANNMASVSTVNRALEYMGIKATAHDLRATMATYLAEQGFAYEYIKAQLSHAKDNQTDAAYFHARFINQRREMLQAWADFLDVL